MLNSLVWHVHRCGTHGRAANTNLLNSATLAVIQKDGQIDSRVEFNMLSDVESKGLNRLATSVQYRRAKLI